MPYSPLVPGPMETARTAASTRAVDESALSSVLLAAVIALVSAGLSYVALAYNSVTSLISVSSGGSGASISLPALYGLVGLAAVGLVLGLLYLWFFRKAFQSLSVVDGNFSTPSTLTLLAIIGLVGIVLVGAGFVALIFQAISCAGSGNPITTACLSLGSVVGLAILLLIVAILALVGYIGLLIGIWRLGTRYDSALFKVGAVLMIIPYVSVAGVILVLLGAHFSRRKLSGGSFGYAFGGA